MSDERAKQIEEASKMYADDCRRSGYQDEVTIAFGQFCFVQGANWVDQDPNSEVIYDHFKKKIEKLQSDRAILVEALKAIATHKQTSIEKGYLIHQCEAYQKVAKEALEKVEEKK